MLYLLFHAALYTRLIPSLIHLEARSGSVRLALVFEYEYRMSPKLLASYMDALIALVRLKQVLSGVR